MGGADMAVSEEAFSLKNQQKGAADFKWPEWFATLRHYRNPSDWRAVWQLTNTLLPYACLWWIMIWSIRQGLPYGLTVTLAAVAALFLVRVFILFHDCVHGSLFPKMGANTFFGHALGMLVFTPFDDWRFSHLRHHTSYADLDARGFGDIWTLTRLEYEKASKPKQVSYRLYRHPVVLLCLGAVFSFLLRFRLPSRRTKRKERMSVLFTNLIIAVVILIAAQTIGLRT